MKTDYLFDLLVDGATVILSVVCIIIAAANIQDGCVGWELASVLSLLALSWEVGWACVKRFADTIANVKLLKDIDEELDRRNDWKEYND